MLTSKYFIQFADFMVNLFNRNTQLICDITNDIDLKLDNIKTLDIPSCK